MGNSEKFPITVDGESFNTQKTIKVIWLGFFSYLSSDQLKNAEQWLGYCEKKAYVSALRSSSYNTMLWTMFIANKDIET